MFNTKEAPWEYNCLLSWGLEPLMCSASLTVISRLFLPMSMILKELQEYSDLHVSVSMDTERAWFI